MEEDIQTVLSVLPIWDEAIWGSLQKKDFTALATELENLLNDFSLEDWEAADWNSMFSGAPVVAGEIGEDVWAKDVRPAMVRAVLNSANGKALSVVLQNLEPRSQEEFQRIFWQAVPENDTQGKLSWLKANKPSIYDFVIAAPSQQTGIDPDYLMADDAGKYLKRYRFITDDLQQALYSYENTQVIYRTCTNHHLSDDKMRQVAGVVGQVILGFVHVDDFTKTLEEKTGMDHRVCTEIADDIRSSVIGGLTGSIASIYEPAGGDITEEPTERTISLEDIGTASKEEAIPVETAPMPASSTPGVTLKEKKPDAPFMLHEENVPEANAVQRPTLRSVTSPLGGFFLKKRKPTGETSSPFAKLEIPGLKPEEKRVVHYSETRTPLTSSEEPSFITIGEAKPLVDETPTENIKEVGLPGGSATSKTIKPKAEEAPEKAFTAPKTTQMPTHDNIGEVGLPGGSTTSDSAPMAPAILGEIKKPEPKVEGNTIDLKGE